MIVRRALAVRAAAGEIPDEWAEAYRLHLWLEAGIALDYRTAKELPGLLVEDVVDLRLALGGTDGGGD